MNNSRGWDVGIGSWCYCESHYKDTWNAMGRTDVPVKSMIGGGECLVDMGESLVEIFSCQWSSCLLTRQNDSRARLTFHIDILEKYDRITPNC